RAQNVVVEILPGTGSPQTPCRIPDTGTSRNIAGCSLVTSPVRHPTEDPLSCRQATDRTGELCMTSSDWRAIGLTAAMTFIVIIVIGSISWPGGRVDTAGNVKTSGAPAPQTTGSGVNSRPATGADTPSTAGR